MEDRMIIAETGRLILRRYRKTGQGVLRQHPADPVKPLRVHAVAVLSQLMPHVVDSCHFGYPEPPKLTLDPEKDRRDQGGQTQTM